jgi:glutamyl-tRNA synthetase
MLNVNRKNNVKKIIEKYALQNAIKYDAAPSVNAVVKKLLGEHPGLRKDVKSLREIVEEEIKFVTAMNEEEKERRLDEIAPDLLLEIGEKRVPKRGLPDLPIDRLKVVMRFAPNPNGPATVGSARGIIVNSEYATRYDGKFILRFDDTDPKLKKPMLEAYDWYLEDCEWLDAKPDEVIIASDRIDTYYVYAEELIGKGNAYICLCSSAAFKEYKKCGKPCPHRDVGIEENMEAWEKMLGGVYDEGEAVMRIKTDMTAKNPALRDWVAFRIVRAPHPRVGEKYIIWPMLDFESAVEDHLLGITHIIRGKDLRDSEARQRFLYDSLRWDYPGTLHWGRIKIHEFGTLSTSSLRREIETGKYKGWDDPRLPTLMALRRRGIHPRAVRNFILGLGIGETDISLSMDNMYAENRKMIDETTNRYFFVWSPVRMELDKNAIAEVPFHPARKVYRRIEVQDAIYVCKEDIKDEKELRLKNLYNIEIVSRKPLKAKFIGSVRKEGKIIHWAPTDGTRVKVVTPSGEIDGIGERLIENEIGNVVQFERFGFVRIDSLRGDTIIAYFAHR